MGRRVPRHPSAEPPGAIPTRWSGVISAGEAEGWPSGRVRAARRNGLVLYGGACVPGGCGPGAAVADGVALAVGDGDAPGGPGRPGRCRGQVPGQVWIQGPDSGHLTGPVS